MKELLLVFVGGGTGSLFRFWISRAMNSASEFPYGTWTVNILGSILIGVFLGISWKQAPTTTMNLLLITGFCGGFTTFSSFSSENLSMLRAGDFSSFAIYAGSSLLLGVIAVLVGVWIARML